MREWYYKSNFVKFLLNNERNELSSLVEKCSVVDDNLGLAFYAGVRNAWNKEAVDFYISGTKKIISRLKQNEPQLRESLKKFIMSNGEEQVVRRIEFSIDESECVEVSLPEGTRDNIEVLRKDIEDSLNKNEPIRVLDRLHTFSIAYIRDICRKHNIVISNQDGKLYPIQNLVGSLVKYYEEHRMFHSNFLERAVKMSISLFESFNKIRNDKSLAHDNKLLENKEARYVVRIMSLLINYIEDIENEVKEVVSIDCPF